MGRKHKISNAREHLMKNLKKLSARMNDSPRCQVKPFPGCPCRNLPCFANGPQERKCFLVPNCNSNCSSSSTRSISECGPFPPSCVNIFSSKQCNPCNPVRDVPLCRYPPNCSCWSCRGKCCQSKFLCCPPRCPCSHRKSTCCRNQCNKCVFMPRFQRRSKCCKPTCCCSPCLSNNAPRCSMKFQKCPAGNLCCRCKTICLPRSYSDTAMTKAVTKRKSLRCSRSVELRGSTLYRGCDCDKKNGLQDRCLRYCCINNPKCKLEPASCHCSKFSCGKHLSKRYGRRKGHRSYTCYVCEPPTCFMPMMPCFPGMQRCCCQNAKHRDKNESGCQCNPSMHEAQCLCSLDALSDRQKIPEPSVEVCCPRPIQCLSPCPSPCLSPCPSPCISPCASPCSMPCPPPCHVSCSMECCTPCHMPYSEPSNDQFCPHCDVSCQPSPIKCHDSSDFCYPCGQQECMCSKRIQCSPNSASHYVPCKPRYCKICHNCPI